MTHVFTGEAAVFDVSQIGNDIFGQIEDSISHLHPRSALTANQIRRSAAISPWDRPAPMPEVTAERPHD
jgi:hypothetical protein